MRWLWMLLGIISELCTKERPRAAGLKVRRSSKLPMAV